MNANEIRVEALRAVSRALRGVCSSGAIEVKRLIDAELNEAQGGERSYRPNWPDRSPPGIRG